MNKFSVELKIDDTDKEKAHETINKFKKYKEMSMNYQLKYAAKDLK